MEIAAQDAYNWGYDPVHWGVPEGSYATDPDGGRRVLEFRQMVQSLHALGLRVVLDVVYNHTYQSGPHNVYSVLDKVRALWGRGGHRLGSHRNGGGEGDCVPACHVMRQIPYPTIRVGS